MTYDLVLRNARPADGAAAGARVLTAALLELANR